MKQVLEYIIQNYTLFLCAGFVVLLAVIGYYADKTNFGQNKNTKNNIEEEKKDLENSNMNNEASDVVEIQNNNLDVSNLNNTEESLLNQNQPIEEVDVSFEKEPEKTTKTSNPIVELINKELTLVDSSSIINDEVRKKEELENKKKEEDFNKFSDEFDSIMPKREVISADLLSEIDDLELGKTQKFNFKDLKKSDNIKLPRISDAVIDEQDIWEI